MKYLKSFLFLSFILLIKISAQDRIYNLDEIVVSATRNPVSFSNLSRSVTVLTAEQIEQIPVDNLIDVLKYAASVDLRARGIEGVQADVAIRGGSFEETLIMIDGVAISDPQTGHNSLNLPISLDNVERIEVLKGEGGRVFGANAFSGAINIITRKEKKNSINISSLGGQNGLYDFGFSGSLVTGFTGNNISLERKKSDGYKDNTNFESENYSLSQNYSLSNSTINVLLGYTDKQFGANSFYSDAFPNQYERTLTKFGNVSGETKFGKVTLSTKLFLRTNFDDYHLDKFRPDWNHNTHRTNSYGGEFQVSSSSQFGTTSVGIDFSKDEINSSNLGIHNRTKSGLFAEQSFNATKNIFVSAGFSGYNYSSIGWKFSPGMDVNYKITQSSKLFASFGRAFRIPTFTELYYVSPANMGNPNLTYEETTNYELGFSFTESVWRINGSIFIKNGTNLIDWVRVNKTDPWQVQNVTDLTTSGIEGEVFLDVRNFLGENPIRTILLSYTYLTSNRTVNEFDSKYLLDHLQHQLIVNMSNDFLFGINQSWTARFEQRVNLNSNFIVDTQLGKRLTQILLFIRATNLFNQSYYDIAGVPLPGRWISAGIKFSVSDF